MTPEDCFREYTVLIQQLNTMCDNGQGSSTEADDLRDKMDPLWYAMTEDHRQSFRRFYFEQCR